MMLAKFDPAGDRDFWLRSFLEYVTNSDPERISPTARPHYVQLQTSRMVDAYLLGLADELRPTLEKLIAWMEAQPEPDRLVFSEKGHDEDAWGLAVYEWHQALGLCKWLSRAGQAERHLTSALNADLQGLEHASPKHAAMTRAGRRENIGVRLATALAANAPQLGLKIYEAAGVKRPSGVGAPVLRFGQWGCRHLAEGGTHDAIFVERGKEMLTASLLPKFFWEGAKIEVALWLKAIYFDSGVARTPEQSIAKAYDSMPGVERPDFVPG
jgi:hypothetical protein